MQNQEDILLKTQSNNKVIEQKRVRNPLSSCQVYIFPPEKNCSFLIETSPIFSNIFSQQSIFHLLHRKKKSVTLEESS